MIIDCFREAEISRYVLEKYSLDNTLLEWSVREEDLSEPYTKKIIEFMIVHPTEMDQYDINVDDLEKRTRAMIKLIEESPKSSEHYIRNQKFILITKLHNMGRFDLAQALSKASHNHERRKHIEESQNALKEQLKLEFEE